MLLKPKDKPQPRKRRNHSRRDRTRSRAGMVRELDALARQEVFERDGHKCMMCSSEKNIQWAHVLSRRHLAIRWNPDNAMTLCAGCHLFWHHQPLAAIDWFRKNNPCKYETLLAAFRMDEHKTKVNVRALWLERCEAGEREK